MAGLFIMPALLKQKIMGKTKIYLEMIKFQHSIFALPFAYLGAFLSEMKVPGLSDIFWITIAMVGARSFAMAVNRLIDIEVDLRNPRTAERALPKGLLSVSNVLLFSVISLGVFLLAVFQLAPVCRYLWPVVVIPFVVYPYTKRFTWFSPFCPRALSWAGSDWGLARNHKFIHSGTVSYWSCGSLLGGRF